MSRPSAVSKLPKSTVHFGDWAAVFLRNAAEIKEVLPSSNRLELDRDARNAARFLEMADVEQTPEGMDRFIERFSPIPDNGCVALIYVPYGCQVDVVAADYYHLRADAELLKEIQAMKRCVGLWRAINSYQPIPQVKWESDTNDKVRVVYDSHPDLSPEEPSPETNGRVRDVILSETVRPEIGRMIETNDTRMPAIIYLQSVINEHQQGRVVNRIVGGQLPKLLMQPCVVPTSLLAGLWLQFANAIHHRKKFQQCEVCASWFEASYGGRVGRQYCSDRCKLIAYRKRVEKAKKLHAKGMSLKQIATQLGSEPLQVKGWISSQRKKT